MELLHVSLRIDPLWIHITIGYIVVATIVYFIQEKFIFKPEKLPKDFTYKYDVPFKELFFDVETNVTINGLHFYCNKPNGLILYLHGNTRSIKGWAKYAKDFYRYNYDVVLVDYRGFGKSTGKRSEKKIINDMQFVYDTLSVQYNENHILVYGRSIGSGFATKIAAENKPRYLILESPYYSLIKVAERFVPFLPNKLLLRYHLRTDWLIPIRHSEKLQKLNPHKITLIRIRGGGHNNLPSFYEYHNFLRDILLY